MEINNKFNIGDIAYVVVRNEIQRVIIRDIRIYISIDLEYIRYKVSLYGCEIDYNFFNESDLYRGKEDFLKIWDKLK